MIYEYECACCSNTFEVEQSIKEEAKAECPKCRVYTFKRLISKNVNFILKGDGWAKDLYQKKG